MKKVLVDVPLSSFPWQPYLCVVFKEPCYRPLKAYPGDKQEERLRCLISLFCGRVFDFMVVLFVSRFSHNK